MQISSETVVHPAMGIGLTDGWLKAMQDDEKQRTAARTSGDKPGPCRERSKQPRDCAYIFQCA
jgi:hypothetical protein